MFSESYLPESSLPGLCQAVRVRFPVLFLLRLDVVLNRAVRDTGQQFITLGTEFLSHT